MTLLLTRATVATEDLRAGSLKHLRVRHGGLNVVCDAELGGDRDRQVDVHVVNCAISVWRSRGRTQALNQCPVFEQKGAVLAPLCDALRAAEI